jgi:hypothetical protein
VRQALFVVLSAISAVYLVVVALLDTVVTPNPTKPSVPSDPITVAALTTIAVTGTSQNGLDPEEGNP